MRFITELKLCDNSLIYSKNEIYNLIKIWKRHLGLENIYSIGTAHLLLCYFLQPIYIH